jgi:hypothetical protein
MFSPVPVVVIEHLSSSHTIQEAQEDLFIKDMI